jgi:hypothetical protein
MSTKKRSVWLVTLTILAALLIAPTFRPAVQSTTPVLVSVPLKADSPTAIQAYPINVGLCINDTGGANDAAGQKDLTKLCMDVTTDPAVIEIQWNWDETGVSGGGQTMNALLFFDTDADGLANYALNVVTNSNPATLVGIEWYSCDDTSNIQCGGATLLTTPVGITCEVHSPVGSDPFAAGASYPNDAVGFCSIPRSSLPVITSTIINTCTIPSDQISSVRSDCVALEGGGFLQIAKYENPAVGIAWDFQVQTVTTPTDVCGSPFSITPALATGYGAKLCTLLPASYSVLETDYNTNSGYNLVFWECKSSSGTSVGTSNGTNGFSSVPVTSGGTVVCEFDNATPTAVTIGSFTGDAVSEGVALSWNSVNEVDVIGYNIYRSIVPSQQGTKINSTMIPAKNIGQLFGADYDFVDYSAVPGLTNYYLIQVVHSGSVDWSDGIAVYMAGFARYLPYIMR